MISWRDTLNKRDDSHLGWDSVRFHPATQNDMQFKIYKSLISGIFHLIWMWKRPQLTKGN